MNKPSIMDKSQQVWHSFRSVPLWVQIWVGGILMPANAVAFLLLDFWSAQMTAIAAIFVVLTNIPIMLVTGGMSKLMSIPHLFAWIPLHIVLIMQLLGLAELSSSSNNETFFIVMILVINSISLFFDGIDSWKWMQGDKSIPGAPST